MWNHLDNLYRFYEFINDSLSNRCTKHTDPETIFTVEGSTVTSILLLVYWWVGRNSVTNVFRC